jgi:hypothetical protein
VNASSTEAGEANVTPRLSAVVVAFTGGPVLGLCLAALHDQAGAGAIEVIVVYDPEGECAGEATRAQALYPAIRWAHAGPQATVPQMRTLGIEASRGEIVALIEGDCVVAPGWAAAALTAHETADVAIGGAVEPGPYVTALDWAVYFCEYGRFMLPLRPSANLALALASNNVTYKRKPLLRAAGESRAFYEIPVHSAWQAAGLPMRTDETLVLSNHNSWSLPHVTSVPYHHGRTFAAQRFPGQAGRRALFGALAMSLPALKTGRVIVDVLSRHRLTGRLIQALPWIIVFVTSWSYGEAMGYLRGPGDSAARWR